MVNLLSVFKNIDLKQIGKTTANIVSLAFSTNKKTGIKIARAVLDNGMTLIKTVTASGVVSQTICTIPEILSVAHRNEVVRDLANQHYTQETIAAIMNISQSTVSNILRGK